VAASGPRVSNRALAWILAVAAVLVAVGVVLVLRDSDDGGEAAAATLEPTGSTGENPFMASVGEDDPAVTAPAHSGGTFAGDTAGLYGGTTDEASCDPDRMVRFLRRHSAEAEAWAGVHGIEVAQIAAYVDTLTPVLLRSDTAVTNHGFSGGVATAFQAVLQAGTAVLVDPTGQPVVKCGCGNPLLAPQPTDSYQGERWPDFDAGRITVVEPAAVEIQVFVLIDVRTGNPFGRPVATDGGQDGPAPDTDDTTATTQAPTTTPPTTTGGGPSTTWDGTYVVTAQGSCPSTGFTLIATGSQVIVRGGVPGQAEDYTGTIQPDGSFTVQDVTGGITGRFADGAVSGTMNAGTGADSCSGTFQGQRS